MVTSRRSTPLEYLVFGLKPEAPDAIRKPYYVAARAGKSETLEFTTEDEDVRDGDSIALRSLAEAVARDVYNRSNAAHQGEPLMVLDVAFSFTPPYATRIRRIDRDATFPLDEESRKLFSAYVRNAYREIPRGRSVRSPSTLGLDGGK